jgi:hypothetical protein
MLYELQSLALHLLCFLLFAFLLFSRVSIFVGDDGCQAFPSSCKVALPQIHTLLCAAMDSVSKRACVGVKFVTSLPKLFR